MTTIRDYLRVLGGDPAGGTADADLIARFAATRDEAAFELLVWRHAGLIQGVCRAVLKDHHAAEDATQAAFLVLAKKAHTFAGRGSVVGWLYRVARRIAVRMAKARQPGVTADLDRVPDHEPLSPTATENATAVCAEVDRLPEHYRVPVLLCFFEGLTHAEAARRTGWPIGTVAGRLARAKELLARRLSRRGVGLAAVALAVPAGSFVGSTARAAAVFAAGRPVGSLVSPSVLSLAEGATTIMSATILKLTAAAAAVCVAAAGVWGFAPQTQPTTATPATPATPQPAVAAAPQKPEAPKPQVQPPPAKEKVADRLADARQRAESQNNLKQILLAMHNYHDSIGHFPGDITDKNGKPLLSWRVAILPYIEYDALYRAFKLDEPWDSENNKKLMAQMPRPYRCGFEPKGTTKTHYQGFAGKGTVFEPNAKIMLQHILDGTSNTIGVIEAGPAVEWSKPADIPYDPKKPFPKLELPFKNVMQVGFCDGSVRAFRPDPPEADFRNFIERDDGNVVNADAVAPKLGPVTKEDVELGTKLLAENQKLAATIADLLTEKRKLIQELAGTTKDVPNIDKLLEEQKDLERQAAELKAQVEALKKELDRQKKK